MTKTEIFVCDDRKDIGWAVMEAMGKSTVGQVVVSLITENFPCKHCGKKATMLVTPFNEKLTP